MAAPTSTPSLNHLVAELHHMNPWPGLVKIFTLGFLVSLFGILTWTSVTTLPFVFFSTLFGFTYASLMITTHDGLHHTLTGWVPFDEAFSRLISYPMLWPHGLYSELHKVHHRMNGHDSQDPERVSPTKTEYAQASRFGKWKIRHQWGWKILFEGGLGFIAHHISQGMKLSAQYPLIRRAFKWDLLGIITVNGIILGFVHSQGLLVRYLLFFFIVERIVGMVQQFRSQIEHYGLWKEGDSPLEVQLFNSRNIETSPWVSYYFNHLNFHSVHHGFPRIPFYALKTAHQKLSQYFESHGKELPSSRSYLRTAWQLSKTTKLVDQIKQENLMLR